MPTTFVYTTFAVITVLNGAGQLAPVDKADLPAGTAGPILFTEAQCNFVRGKMANPEKYVCQVFTSPTETKLVYTAPGFTMPAATEPQQPSPPERKSEAQPAPPKPAEIESKKNDVQVGKLTPEVKEPEQAPKPKRVAQRPRYEQQAMFEGNPFTGFFSW
jgi:hypothetical protein